MNSKVACIDIDGVICRISDDGDYDKCELMPGVCEALWVMKEKGWTIILHTGRHILKMEVTKNWLSRNEVPYDHIQFGKPVADIYIDDKGERFTRWNRLVDKF